MTTDTHMQPRGPVLAVVAQARKVVAPALQVLFAGAREKQAALGFADLGDVVGRPVQRLQQRLRIVARGHRHGLAVRVILRDGHLHDMCLFRAQKQQTCCNDVVKRKGTKAKNQWERNTGLLELRGQTAHNVNALNSRDRLPALWPYTASL